MATDETIKAGKTTLHLSAFGTVSFTDTKGNRINMDDPHALKLFEAIRDGSGELEEITRKDGWQPPKNVIINGKNNAYADNVRSY